MFGCLCLQSGIFFLFGFLLELLDILRSLAIVGSLWRQSCSGIGGVLVFLLGVEVFLNVLVGLSGDIKLFQSLFVKWTLHASVR